jgi:hypothetical protein
MSGRGPLAIRGGVFAAESIDEAFRAGDFSAEVAVVHPSRFSHGGAAFQRAVGKMPDEVVVPSLK